MSYTVNGEYVADGLPDSNIVGGSTPAPDDTGDAPQGDGMSSPQEGDGSADATQATAPELHPAWTPAGNVWQNSGSSSSSVSATPQPYVDALSGLGPAYGILGQQAGANEVAQTQHADEAAVAQRDIAAQDTALRFARAAEERKAQQAEIDLQNQFALQQQHHGELALANSQAARAKMQQDVLALSHMEINPAAGQDTASGVVSTVALFAQGFLAARYGIQTNAQGVLDNWVNRTIQMQQDKIARGEKLVQADQVMWDMARSEAVDQQDELNRVQALLLGRAKAQTALTGSMFLGDAAKLDTAKQTAAIDAALNNAYDAIAKQTLDTHTALLGGMRETAAQAAAAARYSRSSSTSFGLTPNPTAAASGDIPLYDGDVDNPRLAGRILGQFKNDPNARKAKAKWDATRTTMDVALEISKQLKNGVKDPEVFRRFAGEHTQVLSSLYDLLNAGLVSTGQEKTGNGAKLLAVFQSAMGGKIDSLTTDAMDSAARIIMKFAATQATQADYGLQSYTTPGTHLNPEVRKMLEAGFDALEPETSTAEFTAGLVNRGKQDARDMVTPDAVSKEAWDLIDHGAFYDANGASPGDDVPDKLPAWTANINSLYTAAKGTGPDADQAKEALQGIMLSTTLPKDRIDWATALGSKLGLRTTTAIAPADHEPIDMPAQSTSRDRTRGK